MYYRFYLHRLSGELNEKIQEIAQENGSILEIKNRDKFYEIGYQIEGEKEVCDEEIAHGMSDLLQKEIILRVCASFLKERKDLTQGEKEEITQSFLNNQYLSRQEGFSYVTYYLLYLPVFKEISAYQGFDIEGWINFRVHKYAILLKDLLQQFTQDYVSKKEVVNFIRLMRDVSLLAVPLENEMHLVYSREGKAMLYNKQGGNVTGQYIKKYCKDLILDSTLTREDLILHILITICPKKLTVHHTEWMKNKQLINTLEIIFDEGISCCKGCDFCKNIE